jgi:hypothetical protein
MWPSMHDMAGAAGGGVSGIVKMVRAIRVFTCRKSDREVGDGRDSPEVDLDG